MGVVIVMAFHCLESHFLECLNAVNLSQVSQYTIQLFVNKFHNKKLEKLSKIWTKNPLKMQLHYFTWSFGDEIYWVIEVRFLLIVNNLLRSKHFFFHNGVQFNHRFLREHIMKHREHLSKLLIWFYQQLPLDVPT